MAGRVKSRGQFIMLLPRALDPVEAGRDTPVPPERPSATAIAGLNAATATDPAADDPPLPEPKPAADPAPAPRPKRGPR
jgi:hypothetical protein